MKIKIQDQGQPHPSEALPALPEDVRAEMRAMAGSHFFCRVVNRTHSAIIEIPKDQPEGRTVMGMDAEMFHGATVWLDGSVNPLTQGLAVVPHAAPVVKQ